MLSLDDARKRRGEKVDDKPKTVKDWFSKNKSAILMGTGITVLVLGYVGYRYVFKAKNEVKNVANLSGAAMDNSDYSSVVF